MSSRAKLGVAALTLLAGALPAAFALRGIGHTTAVVHAGEDKVTWAHDVAPVVYKNCTACHHEGGSGPFSLMTYRDAQRWGATMQTVTESRYMPPWLPEPGHGDFADSRRMSDAEIATIRTWVQAGMPQGDVADAPKPPVYTGEWQLGAPDLLLTVTSPTEVPASGPDVFLNFVLPTSLADTKWIRAMEIKPGAPRVVHHANVILDRTASLRRAHPEDWQRGVPGMDITIDSGQSFDPDSHFLFWKPDSTALVEPPTMPWRLDPGNDLVLNMHLKPTGKVEHIQARIGLYFAKGPATQFPMLLQLEHDAALDIPAGDAHFAVEDSLTLPEAVEVLAVYPHAHYLGKRLEGFATLPGGETKWLVLIPDWDIERQAIYRLREPMPLPKGTVLHMRYTYDNSAANARNPHTPPVPVHAGNNSTDEMGHLWLQVLPMPSPEAARERDPRIPIEAAWMQDRLRKMPGDTIALFNLAGISGGDGNYGKAKQFYTEALLQRPNDARVLTGLGFAQIETGEAAAAQESFRKAIVADPSYTDARFDLATLLLQHGDAAGAEWEFRQLLTLNATDPVTHSGLGCALLAQGKADAAKAELQTALKLDPNNFDALYNLGQIAGDAGAYPEAQSFFMRAAAARPDADAERMLAITLAAQGEAAAALPHMQAAARLAPDDAEVKRLLAKLQTELASPR